jgi:large subunit ribosomal protein L37Ae
MPKKKKPAIAARFGTRYGSTLRKRWTKVMLKRTATYSCPSCLRKGVERVSVGIWRCRKCGYTFAGGAYEPEVRRR